MTTQEPPNLRDGDNCTTCKHGYYQDTVTFVKCEKYDWYTTRDQLCDDFEDCEVAWCKKYDMACQYVIPTGCDELGTDMSMLGALSAETVHELEVLAGWHNVEISWWGEWQEREDGVREYVGHHFRVRWGDYQINRLFDEATKEFIIVFGVKDMIKYLEYLTKGREE